MSEKGKFKFVPLVAQEFASPLKARTEALRALTVWQARQRGRRFRIVEWKDEFVISQLTWRANDDDADPDLTASCETRHLERIPVLE